VLKPCDFPQIKNGRLHNEERYRPYFPVPVGKRFHYLCNSGFVTASRRYWGFIHCTARGWRPAVPCVRQCVFHKVENGESPYRQIPYSQGESAKVKCYPGYSLPNGQDTVTCTENGWSPQLKCIRVSKECSIPLLSPHLFVNPRNDKYKIFHYLDFRLQCGHFHLYLYNISTVDKVGPCDQPPELLNGEVKGTKKEEYSHDDVVEYVCNPRYLLKGPNKIQCVDGKWTTLPICVEEKRTCGDIPELEHGSVHFSIPPYNHGESVEFTCLETFTMIGSGSVSCINGRWTQLPKCVATDQLEKCKAPKVTGVNGIQPNKKEFHHNVSMDYKCRGKKEYKHSTCINGRWDPEPTCREEESCPPPPQIPNAQVMQTTVKYQDGEKVSILCQDNYRTQDTEEMVCRDGRWQSLPRCIGSTGKCGPPPPIDNGDITSFPLPIYAPSSSVEYQCKYLYQLQGNKKITCRNGEWSEPPKCLHPCVISEEIMERHNITLRWIENQKLYIKSGDYAEFQCKSGYRQTNTRPPLRTLCIDGHIDFPSCSIYMINSKDE
uniref:Sushi domain-containing protein n=1 Tax=Peromyscus maniculatus bairdii TaxID=230844 RepID=A0A8C8UEE3_PERMB